MVLDQIKTFIRANWLLLSGLTIAIIVAIWFATRVFWGSLYFKEPNQVDVELKRWMTPRFIAKAYDLPRSEVFEILQLDLEADKGRRLGRIAQEDGLTMEQLTEKVREAAAQYRARQP